jgi:exodeoxyribonuclease VII large subunit
MEEIERIYTVSELNFEIKEILRNSFFDIKVIGEISGFKKSSLDHIYFDLKDENSIISCVLFKWDQKNINTELKNGMLVKVSAELTTYDKQSKYQLVIKNILPLKEGDLWQKFEELKKKLKAEGLFDPQRKRPIPKYPSYVGVVTSLYGAAVHDIVSIIKRRAPHINIIIYPVKVQGEDAKYEIANAIKEINENLSFIDVLLVGRGGGSLEDLWAFNEEIVARAIASSKIPIISCVGHETDFTIADFVADLRAATPSAAAETVSNEYYNLIETIKTLEKRLILGLKLTYQRIYQKFSIFVNSYFYKKPFILIEDKILSFDESFTKMNELIEKKLKDTINLFENLNSRLKNLNPFLPTKKGYAILSKKDKIIKSVNDVEKGDEVDIKLSDGIIETIVKNKEIL